jgi:hypothetical protein
MEPKTEECFIIMPISDPESFHLCQTLPENDRGKRQESVISELTK